MQKIFYWCPFISNVATVKAVINSCVGLNKYGNLLKPYIINCFGEFDEYNDEIKKNKIIMINLNNNKFGDSNMRFSCYPQPFTHIIYQNNLHNLLSVINIVNITNI